MDELQTAYALLDAALGPHVPQNKGAPPDRVLRFRDRAVIQSMHAFRDEAGLPPYSVVRAAFGEGGPLYEGAGLTAKNHIQLAVRDVKFIKGYFLPIREDLR